MLPGITPHSCQPRSLNARAICRGVIRIRCPAPLCIQFWCRRETLKNRFATYRYKGLPLVLHALTYPNDLILAMSSQRLTEKAANEISCHSGFDASHRPGMTVQDRGTIQWQRKGWRR
jgi:hypothetical protein